MNRSSLRRLHSQNIRVAAALMGTLLLFSVGCGNARPIDRWQKRLTAFIVHQGHKDPSVLRESAELRSPQSLRPSQIRFSEIDIAGPGIPPFVTMRDVHGVLLGQEKDRFFFLLGVVRRPQNGRMQVEDLRLAACTLHGEVHQCRLSAPDPQALEQYLSADATNPSVIHRTFPMLDDNFRLEVRGGLAVARDERSAAVWRISLHDASLASR